MRVVRLERLGDVDEVAAPRYLGHDLYGELFYEASFDGAPVVTRTWKSESHEHSNDAHLHIHSELGFKERKVLTGDRGPGIDTVYLVHSFEPRKLGLWERLKAYQVLNSYVAAVVIFALVAVSAVIYLMFRDQEGVIGELALAFATSLTVSGFCILVETTNSYREAKSDEYLADMREFGIERLDFDKQSLLYERIEGAERRVWASGYRHILTSSLTAALRRAANRGIEIRILCAPPWSEGFRAVYGNDAESVAKVLVNYVKIFRSVLLGEDGHLEGAHCTVRFTHNVIFNDIYCVDDTFVTSPYSYASENTDGPHAQATAREFFTLVVSDDSHLHRLTGQEFEDLWDNAPEELDKERFAATFASTEYMSHAGPDFMERPRSCLDEREGDGRAKAVPIPMPSDAIDD